MNVFRLGAVAWQIAPRFRERYLAERGRAIAPAPFRPHPEKWSDEGLHAAWIGHSTVLLKIDGMTLLTDPVLENRIGLKLGPWKIGMKRIVSPALEIAEVRRPDIVLLSHAHMDHFDIASLRHLESRKTRVVTASRTGDLLRVKKYAGVDELAWGEETRIGEVLIRAFEVRHWGARMQTDVYRGYNGYVIETARHRVIFAGDTAMTDGFRNLRTARGFDLGIMPIGAYNPWIRAHCNPEEAVQMANDAGAEYILPVHHKTFELSSEPYLEPIERLEAALGREAGRIALREIGQEFRLPE